MNYKEIFPTTIASFEAKNFDKKFLSLAKNSFSQGKNSSDNTDVLNLPEFKLIKKEILNASIKYSKKTWGLDLYRPKISCSWFTKLEQNDSITPHRHMHAHLTGVLYLTSGSEICFQNPSEPPGIMPDIVNYKNCYQFFIKPKKGLCLIFSSSLYHSVFHSQNSPRYSIAFNVNPTGTIGQGLSRITII